MFTLLSLNTSSLSSNISFVQHLDPNVGSSLTEVSGARIDDTLYENKRDFESKEETCYPFS